MKSSYNCQNLNKSTVHEDKGKILRLLPSHIWLIASFSTKCIQRRTKYSRISLSTCLYSFPYRHIFIIPKARRGTDRKMLQFRSQRKEVSKLLSYLPPNHHFQQYPIRLSTAWFLHPMKWPSSLKTADRQLQLACSLEIVGLAPDVTSHEVACCPSEQLTCFRIMSSPMSPWWMWN